MRSSEERVVGWLFAGALGIVVCVGGLSLLGWVAAANVNISIFGAPDQQRESEFARTWRPPAPGAEAGRLLPAKFGQWKLVSHDDAAAIAELAIDRSGFHASYESGAGIVEVYAYEVPSAEQSGLFDAADNAISSAGYRSMASNRADDAWSSRMLFSISPPNTHGWLWWSRGWLFVFISHDSSADLDAFKVSYLSAIAAPANSGSPPLESAEPERSSGR